MASFSYKARDSKGSSISGVIEAGDSLRAARNLSDNGLQVISLEQQKSSLTSRVTPIFNKKKVSQQQVIYFTRQMATMIKSGLTLIVALTSMRMQVRDEIFRAAIDRILEDLKAGITLSDSLNKHQQIFNELYVNLVKVGEAAGILDEVLDRLAVIMTQDLELQMRLKSAMIYPLILVIASVSIVSFLLVAIIPKFIVVFESYDAQLPLATRALLFISSAFSQFWYLIIIGVIASAVWVSQYIHSDEGKFKFHLLMIKIPLFGDFYLKIILSQFTRTLGAMVKSGVPILNALTVSENTIGNVVLKKAVGEIRGSIAGGQALSEPMIRSGLFPEMVVQMVAAGEKSGKLDAMLLEVANYYDQETEYAIKNVTAALEPILLLVMGGVVAFIALAVLLPIFNLIKVFKGGI